jgi:hypothetical protein
MACILGALFANIWAMPCEAGSLRWRLEGPIFDLVPFWVAYPVIVAWRGHLRSGLLTILAQWLLPTLMLLAPQVGAEIVGWPGGWALGVAGLVVGAACGWLIMWLFELSDRLNARLEEAAKGNSLLGAVYAPPLSPWAFRGYQAALVASTVAIVLGMKFCPASSWQSLLVFSLAASALGISLDSLYRPWVTRIRESKRGKEQSSKKPPETTPTSRPADPLAARVAQVLKPFESEIHLAPNIPPKKLANATRAARVPVDEPVLGLIDCSLFGSAFRCLVFGSRGFYYNNPPWYKPSPGSVAYSEFSRCQFATSGFFDIRLDKDHSFQQPAFPSGGKLIEILNAIKQAVAELPGQGAESAPELRPAHDLTQPEPQTT